MKTYAEAKKEQEEKALNMNTGAVPNTSGKQYDPSVNYTAEVQKGEGSGNWAYSMDSEKLNNTKEGDLGLGWGVSDKWNYIDRNGYGGQLQAKRNEIENYKPFSYDYRTDESYLAMKRLKEQEANKAYADGYAQLSTAFDGDIPVNMINKLLTTKNEIIDSADSYIPQLRQMAYDMYNVERNDLYNQYGLLEKAAAQDYGRWSADRDIRMQGLQNDIENKYREKVYDRGVYESDRDFDYGVQADALNNQRYNQQLTQEQEDKAISMGYDMWLKGRYPSLNAAIAAARTVYTGAAGSPSSTADVGKTSGRIISAPTGKGGNITKKAETEETLQNGRLYVDENGKIKISY